MVRPAQVSAQDLHFSRLQDLSIWYNSSLSNGNQSSLRLNYRDVKLENAVAYRSIAGLAEISLNPNTTSNRHWNLNLGIATDKSNNGILKNTQALVGLSYAIPLTGSNHLLSFGAQASYSNSRMDFSSITFPDQFDEYGPIGNAITADPLRNSDPNNWFSTHAGIALSKREDEVSWSLGLSVKDLIKPTINLSGQEAFSIAPTYGAQWSYAVSRGSTQFNFYGISNVKAKAFEQLLSASIKQTFRNNDIDALGLGMAYRLKDALVPFVDLDFNNTSLALHYEINISGIKASGFNRNAFEISFKQAFGRNQ